MNTSPDLSFVKYDNVFGRTLSLEALRQQVPAVFAPSADDHRSPRYTFVPTLSPPFWLPHWAGSLLGGFDILASPCCKGRMAEPSFILVPGAGGMAWYWHRIVALLEQAGCEAIAVDLPADDSSKGPRDYADSSSRRSARD